MLSEEVIQDDAASCISRSGFPGCTGVRLARTVSASVLIGCIIGLRSENIANRNRLGCIARIASAIGSLMTARAVGAISVRYRPRFISDTRAIQGKNLWCC